MKMDTTDDLGLVEAASRFAALGSEQRLTVLGALVRAGPDSLAIGVLGERTGITGSTLTHHVRILTEAGLVRQARDGRRIVCHGVFDEVEALSAFLLRQCCADTGHPHEDHAHG